MAAQPWKMHHYALHAFPFHALVRRGIDVVDLQALCSDAPLNTWETDQKSPWHAAFYRDFPRWFDIYERFMQKVVAPLVKRPFYFQRVPTFRVHQPGNLAVGEFHTDAVYHHPPGEITFWLPLTPAHDTCSLWVEDDDGEYQAVTALPGDLIEFSAVTRMHGNKVNETSHSRVSFDFRCLPVAELPAVEGPPTKHTKMRFIPGGYYAEKAVTP